MMLLSVTVTRVHIHTLIQQLLFYLAIVLPYPQQAEIWLSHARDQDRELT